MNRISFRSLTACLAFAAALPAGLAHAQSWKPDHGMEFVVPAGPGAALDTAARELQHLLEQKKLLDQPLVIVNKPGGSGVVALQSLRSHEGDAHWLATFTTGMISARVLHPDELSYTEMTPIALLLEESMLVAVRADSPLKNVHDLVDHLKKKPDSLSIAVATSVGNHIHLAIAKPLKKAGVDITKLVIVPYKSSGESITALLGGHVDVVSASSPNVLSQYKAGKIRLLAVTTAERLPEPLADVPTWKEQGIDAVSTSVQGVLGPKDMSAAQLRYWESALEQVADSKEWKDFLKTQLWRPRFAGHGDMRKTLDAEYASTRDLLVELKLAKP